MGRFTDLAFGKPTPAPAPAPAAPKPVAKKPAPAPAPIEEPTRDEPAVEAEVSADEE